MDGTIRKLMDAVPPGAGCGLGWTESVDGRSVRENGSAPGEGIPEEA